MAKINVNGVEVAYSVMGDGPPIALNSTSFVRSKELLLPLAECLSRRFRVLIWDRRNAGESDICIDDRPSELESVAEDLHELLVSLDMRPAHIGGPSFGLMTSLVFHRMFPCDVSSLLLLWPASDDPAQYEILARKNYLDAADVADTDGMQAVAVSDTRGGYWRHATELNPRNLSALLEFGIPEFAAILRGWAAWFTSPMVRFGNLLATELAKIAVPSLIVPGENDGHPTRTAIELHHAMASSMLMIPSEHYPSNAWQPIRSENIATQISAAAPFIATFVARLEGR